MLGNRGVPRCEVGDVCKQLCNDLSIYRGMTVVWCQVRSELSCVTLIDFKVSTCIYRESSTELRQLATPTTVL
jgi:hypothetical protein